PAHGAPVAGEPPLDVPVAARDELAEPPLQARHLLGRNRLVRFEGPKEERVLVQDFDERERRIASQRQPRVRVLGREDRVPPALLNALEGVVEEGQRERLLVTAIAGEAVLGAQLAPEREIDRKREVDPVVFELRGEAVEPCELFWIDARK